MLITSVNFDKYKKNMTFVRVFFLLKEQYFLLDPIKESDQKEGIHIVVPATTQGSR